MINKSIDCVVDTTDVDCFGERRINVNNTFYCTLAMSDQYEVVCPYLEEESRHMYYKQCSHPVDSSSINVQKIVLKPKSYTGEERRLK